MILYRDAIKRIEEIALSKRKSLKTEKVKLLDSVSRISSQVVLSSEQIPAFANSAMDGFALKSKETQKAAIDSPLSFKVIGTIAAGDLSSPSNFSTMSAFEIMTGAPFPEGFDCCAKIEDCIVTRNKDGVADEVKIKSPVALHQNLREAGHDFQIDSKLLSIGEVIRPEHILALASVGILEVEVFVPVRAALIATGKELVRYDQKPQLGQIRNSTQPYLNLAFKNWNITPDLFLLDQDNKIEFKDLLQKLSNQKYDLIISTGAVSMGQFDFIADSLEELKAEIFFHKVAIRPGKPILFAELKEQNGPVIFSLPGNPVSSVVGFRFFIESYLGRLLSVASERPIKAQIAKDFEKPKGFKCFFKAKLDTSVTPAQVHILEGQMSSMVSSLVEANVWTALEEDEILLKAGETIEVYPLHSNPVQARMI